MAPIFRVVAGLAALTCSVGANAAVDAGEPGEQRVLFKTGDMLQVAVPLAGFALTFLHNDPPAGTGARDGLSWSASSLGDVLRMDGAPRHDFVAAALRMEAATFSLKYAVNEQRPNGGPHSFPSGHTASAFMGAEFIRKEYGWGWATPAYLAASYVGWSRVASDNHWTHDVVAGAAIGVLSNHDFTTFGGRYGTISVTPTQLTVLDNGREAKIVDEGLGLQLQLLFGH